MAITTRGVPVDVVEDGVEVPLTRERLAADVLTAAGGVEAIKARGVPQGGAADTALVKRTGADFDTEWVELPLLPQAVGCVTHGQTAATLRPSGYAVVLWVGTVAPAHALDHDLWVMG